MKTGKTIVQNAARREPMNTEERKSLELYVCQLLGGEKAALWWTTNNPMLGNISPDDMIRFGRGDNLYRFIAAARECNGDVPGACGHTKLHPLIRKVQRTRADQPTVRDYEPTCPDCRQRIRVQEIVTP